MTELEDYCKENGIEFVYKTIMTSPIEYHGLLTRNNEVIIRFSHVHGDHETTEKDILELVKQRTQ